MRSQKKGVWFDPLKAMPRETIEEGWTDKHRNEEKNIVVEGRWVQRSCLILAGQMKTNVKDATKKKATKNTDCINVRVGRKSEVR